MNFLIRYLRQLEKNMCYVRYPLWDSYQDVTKKIIESSSFLFFVLMLEKPYLSSVKHNDPSHWKPIQI